MLTDLFNHTMNTFSKSKMSGYVAFQAAEKTMLGDFTRAIVSGSSGKAR